MWKILLYFVAIAVIVVLGVTLDTFSRAPTLHQPPVDQQPKIFATGVVEGGTNEAFLHAQTKGRVVDILVEEDQSVPKGTVLLQLDNDIQQFERSLAAAQLAAAEAQLEQLQTGARQEERQEAESIYKARQAEMERAEMAWRRTEALVRDGVATQQSGEDDRSLWEATVAQAAAARARYELLIAPPRPDEVRRLEAEVAAMAARLEMAESMLERTRLRAPMDCTVLQINVERGELTGPESSRAPIVVADMSTMRVRAFVEELDALRVKVGMRAEVTVPGSSEKYWGHVARQSPRMATKRLFSDRAGELYDTKTREVWINLKEGHDLLIGLRVDVWILEHEMEEPDAPNDPG